MNRDEADRAIASLGAAYDRAATAMYAIDSDPALGFLRSGGLTGKTAEVWVALQPEIDLRWSDFAAFGDAMEEARAARARYRPNDAAWAEMQQALTADLPRLATTIESSCAALMAILADVNAAWKIASSSVAPVTDSMSSLSRRAADLGDTGGLPALQHRVADIADQILADPLASAPRGKLRNTISRDLISLSTDIGSASARIADQARIRDGYPDRVAALATLIDAVDDAEAGVRAAYVRAAEKIADPGLPPEPHACDVLRARLAEMDARRIRQQWRRLADDVAMMEATIAHALARAGELTDAADGLISRRDELRGRLDAYRAKAAHHRLDEHDALGPLHVQARSLLYTAPCDLHAATKAVYAYQRALTALVTKREEDVTR